MIDRVLQVLFEILECQPARMDRPTLECFLDQRFHVGKREPRNGGLPSLPDITILAGFERVVTVAQELCGGFAGNVVAHGQHRERIEHARSHELVGILLANDVVERVGIAVEHGRHYPMGRHGLGVAQTRFKRFARELQEPCERPVSRFLTPFAEEVKGEKQRHFTDFRTARGRKPVDRLDQDWSDQNRDQFGQPRSRRQERAGKRPMRRNLPRVHALHSR